MSPPYLSLSFSNTGLPKWKHESASGSDVKSTLPNVAELHSTNGGGAVGEAAAMRTVCALGLLGVYTDLTTHARATDGLSKRCSSSD